ncbi:hypothetical protein LCGC14_0739370 [marine sediment metagenome]|uniref:Uncharacterized protein n=1 Tax=marine sediment metagenome TaxID=412755 RepID=A0A0F9Q758_9ZZZZ
MKVYGFRIGDVGLEFSSREDREKALLTYSRSTTISIKTTGVRYQEDSVPFGTYERDSKEVLVNCHVCSGVFSSETCSSRTYPHKNSWEKTYDEVINHICDGCLTAKSKEHELFKAAILLQKDE